jgi:hypothetical protein
VLDERALDRGPGRTYLIPSIYHERGEGCGAAADRNRRRERAS